MTQRKRMKRVISIMLVLCITISMIPSVVFADTETAPEKKINYVSLGDSMTNGFCFTGYNQGSISADDFEKGEGVYGDAAYPNLFADWLEDYKNCKVKHTKLAVSAMRAEDLNYILGDRECPNDGWFRDVRYYSVGKNVDNDNPEAIGIDQFLTNIYKKAITDADIISMSIGNASFGAYLADYIVRMLGIVAGGELRGYVNLEEALAVVPPDKRAAIMQVYNQIYGAVKELIPEKIGGIINTQTFIDMIEYISVGFLLNYEGVLEDIVKINPDVEMILVGLMNTTYGITIEVDDSTKIPFGDILDAVFGILNTYIAGLPAVMQAAGQWKDAKFYYSEVPNPEYIVQKFAEISKSGWKEDPNGLSGSVVRDRTIDAYNEMLRPMIGEVFVELFNSGIEENAKNQYKEEKGTSEGWDEYWKENKTEISTNGQDFLPKIISIESVESFENGNPKWTEGFPVNATDDDRMNLSIAAYLGIEQALVDCTDTMNIELAGLLGIADFGNLKNQFKDITIGTDSPAQVATDLHRSLTANDTLKGICKIFAMFKVGNGMSVHPTPKAHQDIFNNMKKAYSTKYMVKNQILKTVGEDAWWIYNNFEEVTGIVDLAAGSGLLDENQAKQINTLIYKLAELRNSGKIEEAIETAKKIGKILKTATGVSIVALSTASITTTINKIANKRKENANKIVWDEDYTIDVAPTCTEAGMKSIHGSDGVSVKNAEIIPATGHNYGEWMLDTENKATAKKVCANCGSEESKELTIKLATKASKKQITLSWNSVIGAEKYVVYAAKSGGKLKKLSTVEATDKDSYKKTVKKVAGKKLVAGKKYKFYVKALDSNGKQIVKSATKQLKAA